MFFKWPLTGLESHGGASEEIKGGVTTVEDERGPGLDFSLCFVCGSHPWGAAAFLLCLFILLLKCLHVRRFPPPSFRSKNFITLYIENMYMYLHVYTIL